jgi:hypothetical protein
LPSSENKFERLKSTAVMGIADFVLNRAHGKGQVCQATRASAGLRLIRTGSGACGNRDDTTV